jgi:hypothetical protein
MNCRSHSGKTSLTRNLKDYNSHTLNTMLGRMDWNIDSDGVQDYLNELEIRLLEVVDVLITYTVSGKLNKLQPLSIQNKK